MRCSIAICTRNGELFLGEQLASFLTQGMLPDEIVLSDDASTDSTPQIIEIFVEQARARGVSCQVHRHEIPLGVTGNFEFACMQTTGGIIFLSDQDDRWRPEKIERIYAAFEDPAVLLVNSDATLIDDDGRALGSTLLDRLRLNRRERSALSEGDLSKVGAYKNLFTGATMAFRRDLLEFALPLCRDVHHDDWLAQIAWLSGGEVRPVMEPLIDYRLHAANTIGLGTAETLQVAQSSALRLLRYLENQIARLTPVVARAKALARDGKVSVPRLQFRTAQLELAHRRLSYSSNPIARAGQISKAVIAGLYARIFDPWRTAILDLFRSARKAAS